MKQILIQERGQCGNPGDYFAKTWSEYKKGFSKNCEGWLGLDKLHNLTKQNNYILKISFTIHNPLYAMTNFDYKFRERDFEAYYNTFIVGTYFIIPITI